MYRRFTIYDRLQQILEAIDVIEERCKDINNADGFLLSPQGMMIFDSCVMRLQAIGEQVGKLMKDPENPFCDYENIPWKAIYDMRNLISHEYMNIDEAGFDQFADLRRSRRIVPSSYPQKTVPTPVSRAEKHATLLAGICADGYCLKPMLVLQRDTMERELLRLGYTIDKVCYGHSETGFMNTALFLFWAEHAFLPELRDRRAKLNYSGPALLLLDGFGVHHSAAFEAMCEEENIILLFYPPHSSDQLQPCDLGLFANQKRWSGNITVDSRLNRQTKQAIKILDSLGMAATPKNITGAFRKSDIVNRYDTDSGQLVAHVDRPSATAVRHYEDMEALPEPVHDPKRVRI